MPRDSFGPTRRRTASRYGKVSSLINGDNAGGLACSWRIGRQHCHGFLRCAGAQQCPWMRHLGAV